MSSKGMLCARVLVAFLIFLSKTGTPSKSDPLAEARKKELEEMERMLDEAPIGTVQMVFLKFFLFFFLTKSLCRA